LKGAVKTLKMTFGVKIGRLFDQQVPSMFFSRPLLFLKARLKKIGDPFL
jgi:hypothetical protein